jgi:hypothetical protein
MKQGTTFNTLTWPGRASAHWRVCGLTAQGEVADYFGSLPIQTFGLVLTLLQAGKIKQVLFFPAHFRFSKLKLNAYLNDLTGRYTEK